MNDEPKRLYRRPGDYYGHVPGAFWDLNTRFVSFEVCEDGKEVIVETQEGCQWGVPRWVATSVINTDDFVIELLKQIAELRAEVADLQKQVRTLEM